MQPLHGTTGPSMNIQHSLSCDNINTISQTQVKIRRLATATCTPREKTPSTLISELSFLSS
jgi:hypothetical protein